jgi:hypothetical protein
LIVAVAATVGNGRERDEFDTDDCVHCALFHGDLLIGGFRAIPRTDLVGKQNLPAPATLQPVVQRFGKYDQGHSMKGRARASSSTTPYVLFRAAHWAKALVAIADLTYERFLDTLGIERRYGLPTDRRDAARRSLHAVIGEIRRCSVMRNTNVINAIRNGDYGCLQIFGPAAFPGVILAFFSTRGTEAGEAWCQ